MRLWLGGRGDKWHVVVVIAARALPLIRRIRTPLLQIYYRSNAQVMLYTLTSEMMPHCAILVFDLEVHILCVASTPTPSNSNELPDIDLPHIGRVSYRVLLRR